MADAVAPEASLQPLNEVQRVVDTFVAPSKTFTDIKRSASWWLPWVIGCLVTFGLAYAIQTKITWEKVYDNAMRQSPKQMERLQTQPPEAQARARTFTAAIYKYSFWGAPALGLIFVTIIAAVLMATINFGFGGRLRFGQMFAVVQYAYLPLSIKAVLGTITIFAGMDPDSFNLQNYVGTNLGYYLPTDMSKPLLSLATSIDGITIWILVLLTIGCAVVGNVKRSQAAIGVWGWWILFTLFKCVGAMFQ